MRRVKPVQLVAYSLMVVLVPANVLSADVGVAVAVAVAVAGAVAVAVDGPFASYHWRRDAPLCSSSVRRRFARCWPSARRDFAWFLGFLLASGAGRRAAVAMDVVLGLDVDSVLREEH